jgi:hypothetical protein
MSSIIIGFQYRFNPAWIFADNIFKESQDIPKEREAAIAASNELADVDMVLTAAR